MKSQVIQGNNVDVLRTFADNTFDSIVTDPPYGIDFLGKAWDANTGALETYQECLRVLKPGGHIVAFSAARTYHHLAVTIEQAGFEIRDQIMWIYSSGFPKSQDIGRSIQRSLGVKEKTTVKGGARPSDKQTGGRAKDKIEAKQEYSTPVLTDPEAQAWSGWGTQLKPAHEPIVLARKPIKLSIAKNCQKYGVGAINIDAGRVGDPITCTNQSAFANNVALANNGEIKHAGATMSEEVTVAGRFPSNVIGEIAEPYQKYFYCPKVSRRERHVGHETPPPMFGDSKGAYDENGERYAVGLDRRGSLDHIPTNSGGMWDKDGSGVQYNVTKKTGVIDRREMVEAMGGKWVNDAGEHLDALSPDANRKNVWLPHLGNILVHGLTHEYSEWCKANNKDPGNVGNNHPTVKPIELMKYLIKLVTPAGGRVLDPFNGSGSTGCAAVELDYDYTGIELDAKYVAIAEQRIAAWYAKTHATTFAELFETC